MNLWGIDDHGAVLVRPDQHVAWRSQHGVADPAGTLARALSTILSH
jgi:2,4-dichlorophenol 6-monooxygenase